jgi:hypothetical protein
MSKRCQNSRCDHYAFDMRIEPKKPIKTHTRDSVVAAIAAAFPAASRSRVLDLLDTYGVESYERERERVQAAILVLCAGSEDKLAEYVAVAKRDYRDVLYWAEYPDDAKIDTPEKRATVRAMFTQFGVKPPPWLLD